MLGIKGKIYSPEEIWKFDRTLLGQCGINLDSRFPSSEEANAVLSAEGDRWQKPSQPVVISPEYIEQIKKYTMGLLENMWNAKYLETPEIEVVPASRFLERINELEREVNEWFGNGNLCRSPPTMYFFPAHGRLLVPENFVLRIARSSVPTGDANVLSADYDIKELPWETAFFEEAFCEELCHALFRQLRGEWKRDYVSSMKSAGGIGEAGIRVLNEAVAQYAKENIAMKDKNGWGLFVVADKLRSFWTSREDFLNYLAVKTLADRMPLKSLAMADLLVPAEGNMIYADFLSSHPQYEKKRKLFSQEVK